MMDLLVFAHAIRQQSPTFEAAALPTRHTRHFRPPMLELVDALGKWVHGF